jgi:hypothetical protein
MICHWYFQWSVTDIINDDFTLSGSHLANTGTTTPTIPISWVYVQWSVLASESWFPFTFRDRLPEYPHPPIPPQGYPPPGWVRPLNRDNGYLWVNVTMMSLILMISRIGTANPRVDNLTSILANSRWVIGLQVQFRREYMFRVNDLSRILMISRFRIVYPRTFVNFKTTMISGLLRLPWHICEYMLNHDDNLGY